MYITMCEKPIWKGCILYDCNSVTFWKGRNYGESKKVSDCQGLWERER